ncbi:hypothetical protein [Leeuwenhoekiella sp. NPDC079379]|uniref:hypothetical protein n=1 Tax=Leeuwenhoekiella sp. NPDC079379 TaxID=3364122 RepID=UPI0037CC2E66
MKNLIMTVAAAATLLFASDKVNAQDTKNRDIAMNQTEVQAPVNDGFEKIEISNLPKIVTDAVAVDKAGASVSEAFLNEELKVYKLTLEIKGQEPEMAYINEVGRWVEIK